MRRFGSVTFAVLALAAAGCGGGEKTASIPSGGEKVSLPPAPPEPEVKPGNPTPATRKIAAAITKDTKKKPKIPAPKGNPPEALVIHDIVEGKGPAVKDAEQATMDYVGVSWSTGDEFDASWGPNKSPFPFQLGAGGVIKGWDIGVAGMKKGGRRLLVIPPDLGYGAQGQPPDIKPNETLVFVVDLRKIG